jgi:hypothetical protein
VDVNGDGIPDIVWFIDSVYVFLGKGNCNYDCIWKERSWDFSGEGGAYDINQDGKAEILFARDYDSVIVFEYQQIGVEENANCPMLNDALEVFPNPFIQCTQLMVNLSKVDFASPSNGKNKIRIYDIAGKLVETHSITQLPNNSITQIVIGEKLKIGIYFVKIRDYKPIKVVKMSYVQ